MGQVLKCKRRIIGSRRFGVSMDVQIVAVTSGQTPVDELGVVRNLSMRGACIETHAILKADERLTLYLTLPNRADQLEIQSVAVRWVGDRKVGVEFLKLDRLTSQLLMKYLSDTHNAARSDSTTIESIS